MPEGPEIRRIADALAEQVAGRVIDRIEFGVDSLKHWQRQLTGAKIEKIETYGKALVTHLSTVDDRQLCIYSHNQLYGRWFFCDTGNYPDSKRQLRIAIDCQGKSALLYSASDIAVLRKDELKQHSFIKKLGPDVLKRSTTAQQIVERLHSTRFKNRQLGSILTDQSFVAGLGNYLRCEILFYAGQHPKVRGSELNKKDLRLLANVMLKLARQSYQSGGITNDMRQAKKLLKQGASFEDARFYVFRRQGLPCYRCAIRIEKNAMAGQACFYCPQCQQRE